MENTLKMRISRIKKNKVQENSIQESAKKEINLEEFVNRIEKKAYELYEQRGCENGRDWEDWFEAQRIVEDELCSNKELGGMYGKKRSVKKYY